MLGEGSLVKRSLLLVEDEVRNRDSQEMEKAVGFLLIDLRMRLGGLDLRNSRRIWVPAGIGVWDKAMS